MRKFDLSLRSSRSSYFATFRHQLTILSKTDALDEEKWLNMLGTFVKDWFRYESHFVQDRKSGSAGMPRSEERFSRNAETDLVCRLLLEKKKKCRSPAVSSASRFSSISRTRAASGRPWSAPSLRSPGCCRSRTTASARNR